MDEVYCILCNGRGLDENDHICPRCHGTGNEPERPDELLDIEMLLSEGEDA